MAEIIQFPRKSKTPCYKCGATDYAHLWLCFSCDDIMGCTVCKPKGGKGLCPYCREDIASKLPKPWERGTDHV